MPVRSQRVAEEGVPVWLQRSEPVSGDPRDAQETDARQVFRRLTGCWTYWGWKGGYFSSESDALAFHDEVCHMLAAQMAAPNSPQWFNTGLHWAYGIDGPAQGHYRVDPRTKQVVRSTSAYEHPAPHACFIQSVQDDLVNEGGIMDLWVREARIFKYGSGTGSNFSSLRGEGEPLSGGGKSSGLMSFLKIGDRAAGAIKSGGTTRRAAKMVVLDLDHPDIEEFVNWKVVEEAKVASLVTGSRLLNRHLNAILKACVNWPNAEQRLDRQRNHDLRKAIAEARAALVPINYIERVLQLAEQGVTSLKIDEYDTDWNSKAYYTVSGQNSNNSVRITSAFMDAVHKDGPWHLYWRTEKEKALAEGRAPSRAKRCAPANSGSRSPTRPGRAPIPACSTIPPSTNGIPVRRMDASMRQIRVQSTCTSMTPHVSALRLELARPWDYEPSLLCMPCSSAVKPSTSRRICIPNAITVG